MTEIEVLSLTHIGDGGKKPEHQVDPYNHRKNM